MRIGYPLLPKFVLARAVRFQTDVHRDTFKLRRLHNLFSGFQRRGEFWTRGYRDLGRIGLEYDVDLRDQTYPFSVSLFRQPNPGQPGWYETPHSLAHFDLHHAFVKSVRVGANTADNSQGSDVAAMRPPLEEALESMRESADFPLRAALMRATEAVLRGSGRLEAKKRPSWQSFLQLDLDPRGCRWTAESKN